MSKKAVYKSRLEQELDVEEWCKLFDDQNYSVIRSFRNDRVWLMLRWTGEPTDRRCGFDYWDIYNLSIMNSDGKGNWVHDPASRTHWDEKAAIAQYEEFLLKYTESEYCEDEDGNLVLVEVGNEFTPPDPNKCSNFDDDNFVGSW